HSNESRLHPIIPGAAGAGKTRQSPFEQNKIAVTLQDRGDSETGGRYPPASLGSPRGEQCISEFFRHSLSIGDPERQPRRRQQSALAYARDDHLPSHRRRLSTRFEVPLRSVFTISHTIRHDMPELRIWWHWQSE